MELGISRPSGMMQEEGCGNCLCRIADFTALSLATSIKPLSIAYQEFSDTLI